MWKTWQWSKFRWRCGTVKFGLGRVGKVQGAKYLATSEGREREEESNEEEEEGEGDRRRGRRKRDSREAKGPDGTGSPEWGEFVGAVRRSV